MGQGGMNDCVNDKLLTPEAYINEQWNKCVFGGFFSNYLQLSKPLQFIAFRRLNLYFSCLIALLRCDSPSASNPVA